MITKQIKYLAGAALAALAVACNQSDVFYSTSYDIVKAEIRVSKQAPATPEDPDAWETSYIQVSELPAGGSYRLDYTRYDGGMLYVRTSADGPDYEGAFVRTPGSSRITFIYNGESHTYELSTYSADDGTRCTLLTADLTAEYRTLYPEEGIVLAELNEYTTHKE